jgi:hypothetical protein
MNRLIPILTRLESTSWKSERPQRQRDRLRAALSSLLGTLSTTGGRGSIPVNITVGRGSVPVLVQKQVRTPKTPLTPAEASFRTPNLPCTYTLSYTANDKPASYKEGKSSRRGRIRRERSRIIRQSRAPLYSNMVLHVFT